jgi:hypothetical protein
MSWLSELFSGDSSTTITPPTPEQAANYYRQAKANNPAYYEQYLKQSDPEWLAAQQAATQAATTTAQASNPTPEAAKAVYSGPTAEAKLQALLPAGFENTLIPSTTDDPYIESSLGKARGTAQQFIENMFRRGTVSGSGRTAGLSAISAQDPTVKGKLEGVSNALLEGGRAKLRGVSSRGYGAATGQSGETFDPNPYYNEANTSAAQFLSAFPGSYTTAVGDAGIGYDTSGLGGSAGGVTSPANVAYDPYAVEGGKLSTGLEESGTPPPSKKRSTAVF